jgi:hypothetical protein
MAATPPSKAAILFSKTSTVGYHPEVSQVVERMWDDGSQIVVDARLEKIGAIPGRSGRRTHIHNTAVNIAKLLEAKQTCAMSGVIECERLDQ